MGPSLLQVIFGFVTLVCALMVVLGKNPVVSAMALMMTLFSTGILYFSQDAFFIGAVQILIYAGAISVLFIFIVMLLDLKPLKVKIPGRTPVLALAMFSGLLFLVATLSAVVPAIVPSMAPSEEYVSTTAQAISLQFLSKYMIPFQATALLILAAIMGVVLFGQSTRESNSEGSQK